MARARVLYRKLQVRDAAGTLLVRNHDLAGFGLAYDGAERFDSITPRRGLPESLRQPVSANPR